MYTYINGTVAQKAAGYVVIDVGGVGYKIFTDTYTLNDVKTGEAAKIYTFLKVAEELLRRARQLFYLRDASKRCPALKYLLLRGLFFKSHEHGGHVPV